MHRGGPPAYLRRWRRLARHLISTIRMVRIANENLARLLRVPIIFHRIDRAAHLTDEVRTTSLFDEINLMAHAGPTGVPDLPPPSTSTDTVL